MKRLGLVLVLALAGCGDNIGDPKTSASLLPPAVLRALSVDSSHVRLSWTPSPSATTGKFAGYTVSWGGVSDTLSRTTLTYLAGPLPPGASEFSVRSRDTSGQTSSAATIAWAPAYRYDDGSLVLHEFYSGTILKVGIALFGAIPTTYAFTPDPPVPLDFYLQGLGGQQLQLSTASEHNPIWNRTTFSTQTTAAPSLDTALTSFPGDGTFTLQDIPVTDNTIYYARVQTFNSADVHYLRIHIRIKQGIGYPYRLVEVRLSLQRALAVPFASVGGPGQKGPPSVRKADGMGIPPVCREGRSFSSEERALPKSRA
jgi:hypothetical protein